MKEIVDHAGEDDAGLRFAGNVLVEGANDR